MRNGARGLPPVRLLRLADQIRYGGGLNWYICGQNLKVSPFCERIVPRQNPGAAPIPETNHFGVQMQAYYFRAMKTLRVAFAALFFMPCAATARAQEILVFAAASLTEATQEIGKAFEAQARVTPRFSFGASSDLARQIKAGAPADVFFSADTAKMDDLERTGLVRREDRREFLSNVLVVIVPRQSAVHVTAPEDLVKFPRLAIADPAAVPAGIYARKWLEAAGVWSKIEPGVVPTLDVRAALAAVATGSVPAGIVYRTDAAVSRDVRIAWTISHGPQIIYSLARLAKSSKESAARFVDFVAGPDGRAVFERHGFAVRPPGP